MKNIIEKLYFELRQKHGRPAGQWNLWCHRPKTIHQREQVIIGAILTQNTNWKNVDKAMANLKIAGVCCLKKIVELGKNYLPALQQLIRPAGFFNSKGKYLLAVADYFAAGGGVMVVKALKHENTRTELLKVKGVGPETADSILNYALDKPIFVIDEYTRRIVKNKQLAKKLDYDYLQKLFEKNIRKDWRLYQDFHALIVIDNKKERGAMNYVESKN